MATSSGTTSGSQKYPADAVQHNDTSLLSLCFFFNWAPRHEGALGNGGISPRILDLGTRWRWVVSFTPQPLYSQGKDPWYPLDRRLGGPQSRSGRCGEKKNSQPPPELEPPIIQPVARRCTTELSRLLSLLLVSFFFPTCQFCYYH
jgi:hypothetical protein